MPFTVCEVNGDQPIGEWLVIKLKEYAMTKYGLMVNVELVQLSHAADKKTESGEK